MQRLSILPALGIACLLSFMSAFAAQADEQNDRSRFSFDFEGGPAWQAKNDVRIPGDTGTKFSFKELTGSGPYAYGRFTFDWDLRDRHRLRFVVAPLRFNGRGTFDQPVTFANADFAPGTSTRGKYKFDTYRISYRYLFLNRHALQIRAGGSLLVRDARIELEQGGVTASDSDFGFAPLLNLSAEWAFAERWTAILDFEGLAGGSGRALDLALTARYDLTQNWHIGAGYRMLEGGVDSDSVYNFSWINYGFLTLGARF